LIVADVNYFAPRRRPALLAATSRPAALAAATTPVLTGVTTPVLTGGGDRFAWTLLAMALISLATVAVSFLVMRPRRPKTGPAAPPSDSSGRSL
jgi:hypothetical protein